jgi:hypothetical protein
LEQQPGIDLVLGGHDHFGNSKAIGARMFAKFND